MYINDLNNAKMLKILLLFAVVVVTGEMLTDPATRQLAEFKTRTKVPIALLTTTAGAPVEYSDATSTLNTDVLDNDYLIEDMMNFVRERTPERVVHGPGTGAFGYFDSTKDISHICKAKLFEIGRRTPIAVRFSLGFTNAGTPDTKRDLRGMAVKFYSEDGIYDFPGFNTPVFAFKDSSQFAAISRASRRNPATNLIDPNMSWDFITQRPETIFVNMFLYSDYGTPRGYKHMPGFPIHTYQVVNKYGDTFFVRFHYYPERGIKNFNTTEIKAVADKDPDFYTRDLYNDIATGEFPAWEVKIQVVSLQDVKNSTIDFFSVVNEIPIEDFPLQSIGRFVLNRNPRNHRAEIESLAFCPSNFGPGMAGAPDSIFKMRRLMYKNAQLYRLGSNFNKIPVNCPVRANTYVRDGVPPLADNGGDSPNYYPNSFNGPMPYKDENKPRLIKIHEKPANNFKEAARYYLKLSSREQRSMADNIAESLCSCEMFIKRRALHWFTIIHPDFGKRVENSLQDRNCLG